RPPSLEIGDQGVREPGVRLRGRCFLGRRGQSSHGSDYTEPDGVRTSGRMLLDECEHPPPCVVARVLPLLEAPVEKAVRGSLVNMLLECHARLLELLLELHRLLGRRRLVI